MENDEGVEVVQYLPLFGGIFIVIVTLSFGLLLLATSLAYASLPRTFAGKEGCKEDVV